MSKVYTAEEALAKMRLMCSRAEHCTGEVAEKLRKMGISGSDTRAIIEELIKNRYIDDSRFAEAFVRDKFLFAKWGRRKIAYALALKRIPKDIASAAIDTIDDDEYEMSVKNLAKAKSRGVEELPFEDKNKIYRWLLSRGFESDVVAKVMKKLR